MFQQCGRVVRVKEGEEEGHSSPWVHDQTLCTVSGRQAGSSPLAELFGVWRLCWKIYTVSQKLLVRLFLLQGPVLWLISLEEEPTSER